MPTDLPPRQEVIPVPDIATRIAGVIVLLGGALTFVMFVLPLWIMVVSGLWGVALRALDWAITAF